MRQNIPRPEYPRPQFVRDGWMNLNGTWQFEMDPGDSGRKRGLVEKATLDGRIIVPFCMESSLSGVRHTDFMRAVWYKRAFVLPEAARGKHVLLHFGAVDYASEVWVNGTSVGTHKGGYTSFSFDITDVLIDGENVITLCAQDDTRSGHQPSGKQSPRYESYGCYYTRTTGIWQTVWLEWVDPIYMKEIAITPHAAQGTVTIRVATGGACTLRVCASYEGKTMGEASTLSDGNTAEVTLALAEKHLWNVGEPKLYDLVLELTRGEMVVDRVESYFGLRSVRFDGLRFMINDKPVFQRLVLDQGFYPDGIYTAPTDEALRRDIELSMAMGFNGARLHEKVFEARFLYHADHMGYLCWGEMANWGLDHSEDCALADFLNDWIPAVKRDYSAPSIVGWCPFNETWDVDRRMQRDDVPRMTYRITKAIDATRPCIDTSGNYHVETDIYDVHDYLQDPAGFAERYGAGTPLLYERFKDRQNYMVGLPAFVSEYGGIWWSDTDQDGWGYGERVKSREEFLERYRGLTETLLKNPEHFGFCYTQLTDVEQEQNGLYTYHREPKFPPEVIRAINSQKAACEE